MEKREPEYPNLWNRLSDRVFLSDAIYCAVLFFLAAGRIHFHFTDSFDIKIGESIENLVPVLLIARYLRFGSNPRPTGGIFKGVLPGAGLILVGLLVAAFLHPTEETFEDILRVCGQFVVALLIVEWMVRMGRHDPRWGWAFAIGILALLIRTPWTELADPNLEGPFPHRNIQAGFAILAIPPILMFSGRIDRGVSGRSAFALGLVLVLCAFIVLSKSRSGMIALLAVALVLFLRFIRIPDLRTPKRLATIGVLGGVGLIVVLYAMIPRFEQFGQELTDPYRRSRIPIWAAAVDSWSDPTVLLFGMGMEDSFDRVLLDTPQGNLNYRYRKAHYPHGLYLQWTFWGGLTALLGWIVLIGSVGRKLRVKDLDLIPLLLGACLVGYFTLEVFESAFRDPRVAAMFWTDLLLFHFLASSPGEETSDE